MKKKILILSILISFNVIYYIKTGDNNSNISLKTPISIIHRIEKINETSPIIFEYNDKVKRFIDVYTIKQRAHLARILGRTEIYFPLFEEILDKYNLPLELKYVSVIESALVPTAISSSKAVGLWQFLYNTSKMFDLKIDSYVDERQDPYKSTEAACKYFRYLYSIFQDWRLVIAAFNGGPGAVRNAIAYSGGKTNFWDIYKYLPPQTKSYLPIFIAATYSITYHKEYNIAAQKVQYPFLKTDTITVKRPLDFKAIASVLAIDIKEIRKLNPIYKLDFIPQYILPTYITLPVNKITEFIKKEHEIYSYKSVNLNYHARRQQAGNKVGKIKVIHTVEAGEYFHKIALKYDTMVEHLKNWNNLSSDFLYVGQKLDIWVENKNSKYNNVY